MMSILVILIIASLLSFISALTIECDFNVHSTYGYGCEVKSFHDSSQLYVMSFTGDHINYTNADVKHFIAESKDFQEFPVGLEEFFPNLETINVNFPNLTRICNQDLKPFGKNLKNLIIRESQIEFLSSDLFVDTPNISFLNFKSDKTIKNIQKGIFRPLSKLNTLMVALSCEEDEQAMNRVDVEELIGKMEISCYKPNEKAPEKCRSEVLRPASTEKPKVTTTTTNPSDKTEPTIPLSSQSPVTATPNVTSTEKPEEESNALGWVFGILVALAVVSGILIAWFKGMFRKKAEGYSTAYESEKL